MKLKKLGNAAVITALFIAGCAGPQVKTLVTEKAVSGTLKSIVMVNYISPASKIKKKSILAVKGQDLLRYEIKGFFNEPLFILVANGKRIQAYFVQDNACFEGELFDQSSDNLASIFINQSGKLKLKTNGIIIDSSFTVKDKNSRAPAIADFTAGDYKISFSFLEPEMDKELSNELFEIKIPENTRRISEEEINRYLLKWSK